MPEHTLKRFDEELERLNAAINQMGGLTESQLAKSLEAVRERDTALAEQVIAEDARVDALDVQVQQQTVQLLALRQPMAVDLRVVLSSIKIAAALERIADYAKNTAKRSIVLTHGAVPCTLEPKSTMMRVSWPAKKTANVKIAAKTGELDAPKKMAMAVIIIPMDSASGSQGAESREARCTARPTT